MSHREINLVVIHCSATPNGVSLFEGEYGQPEFATPVEVIDRWHYKRGFRRSLQNRHIQNEPLRAIGYHFVVYTAGVVATGRHYDEIGAHVVGNNLTSLGVCMIGTDRFTPGQWNALRLLVQGLRNKYPRGFAIRGHRDLSPDQDNDGLVERWEWLKTCPGFDVAAWLARGMQPDPANVLEQTSETA